MPVLIGSRALNYWFPECKIKPDADWDIITTRPQDFEGDNDVEIHDQNFLNNREVADKYHSLYCTVPYKDKRIYVMKPAGLALIKRSHLWRDLAFSKHMTHYAKWLKGFFDDEVMVDSVGQMLYDQRLRMTREAFPQGNPNLNQSVKDFFDDAVKKTYSHDWLHELFAVYSKPMYTQMQRNPESAWCEKDMWDNFMSFEKIACVAEESSVIATERFLIPSNWQTPEKLAYMKSLEKVCTTLCSGWFRDFAIDNYGALVAYYDTEMKRKFASVKAILQNPDERKVYA